MNRTILCLLASSLVLNGCGTTTTLSQKELASQSAFKSKEMMLLQAGNKTQLIQLYKNSLKAQDSADIRIKLVEAYIAEEDFESAAFHLQAFQDGGKGKFGKSNSAGLTQETESTIVFLQAKVLLAQGKVKDAFALTKQALGLKTIYPEAENLMGLIQAEMGNFKEARYYFYEARRHYYDDSIVKNNLAVLDLIEENYQGAVDKLQPLYRKGQADEKIAANLAVAYAKLGN